MRMIVTVMFVLILELEFDLFFSFIALQIYNTILCHDISSVFFIKIFKIINVYLQHKVYNSTC